MAKLKKQSGLALPDDLFFEVLLKVKSAVDLCKYKCVSKSWRKIITNPAFFKARTEGLDQGQGAAVLPDDLAFEVLKRVGTVGDLGRYKCVSKSWHSILTDPRFYEARQTRIPNRSGGIVMLLVYRPLLDPVRIEYWYTTPVSVGIRQPFDQIVEDSKCSLRIQACVSNDFRGCTELVNGLTCIYESNKRVSVCNICTGQTLRLPDNEFDGKPLSDNYSTRCFLGYIPGSRVYKLLKLSIVCTNLASTEDEVPTLSPLGRYCHEMQAEILTLGTDSWWRKLDDRGALSIINNEREYSPISFQFVLVDGVMFWDMRASIVSPSKLITFDLNKEKFRLIRPPTQKKKFMLTQPPTILAQFRGRPALWCDDEQSVAKVKGHITFYTLEDERGYLWSKHTPEFICPDFRSLCSPRSRWSLIPLGNIPATGQILLWLFIRHWFDDYDAYGEDRGCSRHIYSYDYHRCKFERFIVGDSPLVEWGSNHCEWGWLEENYADLEDLLNLKK